MKSHSLASVCDLGLPEKLASCKGLQRGQFSCLPADTVARSSHGSRTAASPAARSGPQVHSGLRRLPGALSRSYTATRLAFELAPLGGKVGDQKCVILP